MILIVSGEDVDSSRNYFIDLKKHYTEKGFLVKNISIGDIPQIRLWMGEATDLFGTAQIFVGEHFNKKINLRNKQLQTDLDYISKEKSIYLLIWEDVPKREVKLGKIAQVKDFPLKDSIFKLLEAFYPSNRTPFLHSLDATSEFIEESFIFAMFARHIRNLILAKSGGLPKKMPSWQAAKLVKQAQYWREEALLKIYEAILRLDIASKTSTNPFSLKQSIDILAAHFI